MYLIPFAPNAHTDVTNPDLYFSNQRLHLTGHSHEHEKQEVKMSGILIWPTGWRMNFTKELYMFIRYILHVTGLFYNCFVTAIV